MTSRWMHAALFATLSWGAPPEVGEADRPVVHRSAIERFLIEGAALTRPPASHLHPMTSSLEEEDADGETDAEEEVSQGAPPSREELEVLP